MPQRKGIEEEILKGMYLLKAGEKGDKKVQLMGSGVILNEVIKGAELLKNDFGVDADIWSVPSFNLLHRDAIEVERYNPCTRWKKPSCRLLPASCKAMKAR